MNLRRLAVVSTLCLSLGLWAEALPGRVEASPVGKRARPDVIFVQAPLVASGDLAARFPQGSRLARLRDGRNFPANLTPEFFAAADPQISFDGARVLFAAQSAPSNPWQIWEMSSDGSGKRQVTGCDRDCLRPVYLPRDLIAYTVVGTEGGRRVSQIHVSQLDGANAGPITFGPGDFQIETVLRDGRLLISASSPLVAAGEREHARELYALRHDGTSLSSFRCNHGERSLRAQAAELDDGSVVYVKREVGGSEVGGELAQVRRGALRNSPLSPAAANALSPRQLEKRKLIVARQDATHRGNPGKFDLYTFDAASGQFGELVYRDPKLSSVQAVPVAAHPVPRWYWSTTNAKDNAGYFICLDSYHSAGAPQGRIAAPIARVRVLMLEGSAERTLGEAPVEQDGSFYLAVPPDRPVRFELLDASGKVIRAQRSWVWVRPGEERGCVGCHEDKSVAPPNRWPQTLKRFDTPTRLGVAPRAAVAH